VKAEQEKAQKELDEMWQKGLKDGTIKESENEIPIDQQKLENQQEFTPEQLDAQ